MLRFIEIVRTSFILILVIAVLLPSSAGSARRGEVVPASLPKIYVYPSNVTDPSLSPSENITIEVNVANVTDFAGFDVQLSWDASLLNYTSHLVKIPVEDHPDGVLHEPVIQVKNEVNATTGTCWIAFATLGGPSFNGSGTIFVMNFTILGFGACTLCVANSDLSNSQGSPISHTAEDGYFSNTFYDVAILDVAASPSTVLIGELVNVTVIVLNNGTTRNETFDITAYYDITPIDTETILNLPPSGETTLQFCWNTSSLSPGDYTISANATGVPEEVSTENNRLVNGIVSLIIEPLYDVAVTSVTPSKTVVCKGHCLHANVTLENQGDFAETVNVTLSANERVIDSASVYLSRGATVTVLFSWNTTDAIEYQSYVLNATVAEISGENDTGDNSLVYEHLQVVNPGDFDGDMDVDIFDIVMIAAAYGTEIGDSEYNSNFDVNCDGEIDILDVVLVTPWYGYQRP
jgi:hypothetical protein